ncbi:VOC family protein [Niabella hibiscisoli]|uniref:VOC family protein n=1 Tax=Niabella hibiscisoli TaxID=1825928 RepID=UPI001F0EC696|nr:VOC family protein [Niabella hibiscisoli]MCH5716825.1 VOC family protein [Niabella hibiscisoli]
MIQGLYETHLFVENLENSVNFYKNILGLTPCYYEEERRTAFFWVGKPREAMLGLWEKPQSQIYPQHFAFRCDEHFIVNNATDFLLERDLLPYNFLKNGTQQPMVFAWMPPLRFILMIRTGTSWSSYLCWKVMLTLNGVLSRMKSGSTVTRAGYNNHLGQQKSRASYCNRFIAAHRLTMF